MCLYVLISILQMGGTQCITWETVHLRVAACCQLLGNTANTSVKNCSQKADFQLLADSLVFKAIIHLVSQLI